MIPSSWSQEEICERMKRKELYFFLLSHQKTSFYCCCDAVVVMTMKEARDSH